MWLMRALGLVAVVAVLLLAGGFLHFMRSVGEARAEHAVPRADAIVALTGGASRIDDAVGLLVDGKGSRMLISGVHPSIDSAILKDRVRKGREFFDCCIDLGYEALNTAGNAVEARDWLDRHRFRSVILVTSDYHMPRSLTEFARSVPDTRFIPYPVRSEGTFRDWWLDPAATRLLLSEYVKYVVALARARLEEPTAVLGFAQLERTPKS